MGETNEEAKQIVERVLDCQLKHEFNPDGTISLVIGDIVITAPWGLWSDPSVFDHGNGLLTIHWGGQIARIHETPCGPNVASVQPDPMSGKAREVF